MPCRMHTVSALRCNYCALASLILFLSKVELYPSMTPVNITHSIFVLSNDNIAIHESISIFHLLNPFLLPIFKKTNKVQVFVKKRI